MVRLEATSASGIPKVSVADTFQVRSLSTNRFVRQLGNLTQEELEAVRDALAVVLGIAAIEDDNG